MICILSTLMGRRRLKIADVARGTGLHRNVIQRYYHDQAQRYDKDVLKALCIFFEISPGELIVLEAPDSSQAPNDPASRADQFEQAAEMSDDPDQRRGLVYMADQERTITDREQRLAATL